MDFIKIRQIISPPKLNKNNNFLDKKNFLASIYCVIEAFDIIINDEDRFYNRKDHFVFDFAFILMLKERLKSCFS